MCIIHTAHPLSRTTSIISESLNPETSFTMSAPDLIASTATFGLRVSIEISPSGLILFSSLITGITLLNSSSTSTGSAPGLVDSPPMSSHIAPESQISNPLLTASFSSNLLLPP